MQISYSVLLQFLLNLLIKSCFLLWWNLFIQEDEFFFEKKCFTVFQKRLLSVIFFSFKFVKLSFLDFRRSETPLLLCLENSFQFLLLLFCNKLFFKLYLVVIALEISLLIKRLWIDRISRLYTSHIFFRSMLIKNFRRNSWKCIYSFLI